MKNFNSWNTISYEDSEINDYVVEPAIKYYIFKKFTDIKFIYIMLRESCNIKNYVYGIVYNTLHVSGGKELK